MSSPTNYTTPYPPTAPYGSQFLNGSSSLPYSSGSYDMRASWKQHAIDPARMEDVQSTRSSAGPGSHLDSGKRHLEGYDVEVVFNEIIERSSAAIEFARHFSAKAHQNNRSVPAAGSMPQLSEIDELAQIIRKSAEALDKIRCYVVEQTLAEQQAEQRAQTTVYQRRGPYNDDQAAVYREGFKGGGGGFAGGDSKKRRGNGTTVLMVSFYSLESCPTRSLPQLQPSGNPGMETRAGRRADALQRLWPTLRQIDPEVGWQ
ncbi:uncharacterized protein PADG_12050 [Paracoccidioides brasiliensis Pb18]|uniref:Uncharacterized protein n=1 Tax=Paracoccidioides brasiliensis (strain Pb18) TaxID=502780 RepID=A0A0A0HV44_PARBD|nr:uncharacterized protein PADG_12050 [Paracoccidioides brasiliensis Pb18]KGM91906.1 hypothetical protein PADG_12050 [Paracoccidioides brasiliensis Pb18]